jgi:hypothetical protein
MKHALALFALAGCVDHHDGVTGTQSIAVELLPPTITGDMDHRLGEDARNLRVELTAYDAQHDIDASFTRDVQVYIQFLGTLTPSPYHPTNPDAPAPPPLTTIHMTAGKALAQSVSLPPVFGMSSLWVEDVQADNPTYATGASPALWFREPVIADIQTPISEMDLNALQDSPLENKQITISSSRYGDVGRLVVTSVFAQGYTVSDVKCSDATGAPPCVAAAYDHVEVFSFSAPTAHGKLLQQGQVIDGFTGAISEFNGLTEIGFPTTVASSDAVDERRLPVPVKLDPATWFKSLPDPQGVINFERNEAAPIEIDGAKVCSLDGDYDKFSQWKLDPSGIGGDCAGRHDVINVVTAGVIAGLDPKTLVGKTLPRVVGVVRPVFTIWIIFPRSSADLTLQ